MNINEFRDPPARYRTSPFWSWNDRLEAAELRRQVREFARQGFGGYFMHSRVGLRTPYLSPEWMRMIRACLNAGRKHKLESWLYDEDKWPSGFAGGLVPAKNEAYRQRAMFCRRVAPEAAAAAARAPGVIAVFAVRPAAGAAPPTYRRLAGDACPAEGEEVWVFDAHAMPRSNWYNGETYVDLMNPDAVEEFLKVTEDAYARRFRKDFGPAMPGIFTDEPNYFSWFQHPETKAALWYPWTAALPEHFRRLNGYDLLDRLPDLALDTAGGTKLRHDFYRTALLLFRDVWSRPSFARCARYGLQWTGHFLAEDNLGSQIAVIGAAMPHYEFMQVPGIDHLGRNIADPLTLKQCSSVAHQFGRNRVLCEIFGVSGHSMTFEDQKWIADFHFALGITFLCQHLTLYSMTGDRKRDYPPTISDHQPYWPDYRRINDYFARACYLLQQGDFAGDILVLHSIASAWADHIPSADEWPTADAQSRVRSWNDALVTLMQQLLELHRDFDFGDEIILEKHAAVSDGLPGLLAVAAKGRYRLVIVPPSLTWSMATVVLLRRFLDAGGRVLFVGRTPTHVDAEPNEKVWQAILAHPGALTCGTDKSELERALALCHPRRISVADSAGDEIADIYVHERLVHNRGKAAHVFFLANKNRTQGHTATVRLPVVGALTAWNLQDGTTQPLACLMKGNQTVLTLDVPPVGSVAFSVDTARRPRCVPRSRRKTTENVIAELRGPWEQRRLHPNSLTLDFCQYRFDQGPWQGPVPVWKVRHAAWREAGLEAYTGIQPWALEQKGVQPAKTFDLHMQFAFHSMLSAVPSLALVLENGHTWLLTVNGRAVATATRAWHWDRRFSRIDLTALVREGENTIELGTRYGLNTEVEDVYLVGDFGVRQTGPAAFALAEEPKTLAQGDWVTQGYPFYAGNMLYTATAHLPAVPRDQRLFVRLCRPAGCLFRIGLNDRPLRTVWCQTAGGWEADLTRDARPGTNRVRIEVVGTLRNTFGPLHHQKGDALGWVGPHEFVDERNWVDAYQFAPYGLLGPVQILLKRRL